MLWLTAIGIVYLTGFLWMAWEIRHAPVIEDDGEALAVAEEREAA